MIRTVGPEELSLRWNEIKPYIDMATEHGLGELTSHDMFVGVMNGTFECWEVIEDDKSQFFGMVRINHFPQHKQLQVVTTAGEDWDIYGPKYLEDIENTARYLDCKHVVIWGRPGWQKKLKQYGYNYTYAVLSKEV